MAAPTEKHFDAIHLINSLFGEDLDSLKSAKKLLKYYESQKKDIEKKLSRASLQAPGKIKSAVRDAETTSDKVNRFSKDKELLCDGIANHQADVTTMVTDISTLTDQIEELEKYTKYMQVVGKIEDLSSDIQTALIINSTERSVTKFSELAEITKTLQSSSCNHLVKFANETVVFWYQILKEKLLSEFEEVMNAYQWPFIVKTTKKPVKRDPKQQSTEEIKAKLEPLFNHLLHLQLPEGLSSEGQPNHPFVMNLPGWRSPLLPVHIMLRPFKKRFKYHFYGKKQTNSLDKPEWYLTLILSWIRDHREFLKTKVQPILEKNGLGYVNVVVEFSRGLVVLAMEKLLHDIPNMVFDEQIFSHMIDEVLSFDKDLKNSYGYPESLPGCLHILTQETCFDKWLRVEKKYALEKMDTMTSSDSAWLSQYKDLKDITEVDELKVPECGESFMTLMVTMTERYKTLPYAWAKLKFLDLQLELLDDYRIRLLQVKNQETNKPLGNVFTAILNTVNCIVDALIGWSDMVFFVQLHFHRVLEQQQALEAAAERSKLSLIPDELPLSSSQSRQTTPGGDSAVSNESIDLLLLKKLGSIEEGSVFDEMIQLLKHMKNDMMTNIVSYVVDDTKARSKPYRRDKWLALPSQKDLGALALSPSACEMLLVLKAHLHTLEQALARPLFVLFWNKVANDLNKFLFEEVILANHFNEGGAAQLNFDMTRNLFPLFGQYTQKPENYFRDVKEACILLTLNVGSALLLKDILYRALHEVTTDPNAPPTDPIAALHDFNITKLSPEDAELVISLRTNMSGH